MFIFSLIHPIWGNPHNGYTLAPMPCMDWWPWLAWFQCGKTIHVKTITLESSRKYPENTQTYHWAFSHCLSLALSETRLLRFSPSPLVYHLPQIAIHWRSIPQWKNTPTWILLASYPMKIPIAYHHISSYHHHLCQAAKFNPLFICLIVLHGEIPPFSHGKSTHFRSKNQQVPPVSAAAQIGCAPWQWKHSKSEKEVPTTWTSLGGSNFNPLGSLGSIDGGEMELFHAVSMRKNGPWNYGE